MNTDTLLRRACWTLWGLLPVGFLAFHYGPGQRFMTEDKAGRMLAAAHAQAESAQSAQEEAFSRHVELVGLRMRLSDPEQAKSVSEEEKARLSEAVQREKAAYAKAAEQWRGLSEQLSTVETVLRGTETESADAVRIAKARAMIRGGLVNTGIEELEATLGALEEQPAPDADLVRQAREELATGHYYNAWLMRLAGHPTEEWKDQTSQARQQYRYLAESARGDAALQSEERPLQLNIERVLNLEQSGTDDLMARPLPKNAPESRCQGDKPCNGKGKGKKKGKGQGPKDGRGAGSFDDMGPGW